MPYLTPAQMSRAKNRRSDRFDISRERISRRYDENRRSGWRDEERRRESRRESRSQSNRIRGNENKALRYSDLSFRESEREGSNPWWASIKAFGASLVGYGEEFAEFFTGDESSYWDSYFDQGFEQSSEYPESAPPLPGRDSGPVGNNFSMDRTWRAESSRRENEYNRKVEEVYSQNVTQYKDLVTSLMEKIESYKRPASQMHLFQSRQAQTYLPSSIRSRGSAGVL